MALYPDPDFTFGPWTLEDAVVGPVVVSYLEDGDPADLSDTIPSGGRLEDPAGLILVSPVLVELVESDPTALEYTLPGTPWLIPGIWSVSAILSVGANSFRTVPARFVVDDPSSGWLTVPEARMTWRDAPSSDVVLYRLLYSARLQVVTWGRDHGADIPPRPTDNLVSAQHTQARNTWNAIKSDPANQGIGDEGFVIRPFPLDWTVKNLIRPQSAKPVVR